MILNSSKPGPPAKKQNPNDDLASPMLELLHCRLAVESSDHLTCRGSVLSVTTRPLCLVYVEAIYEGPGIWEDGSRYVALLAILVMTLCATFSFPRVSATNLAS